MRAEDIKAPNIEAWMVTTRPRGTLAIVPRAHVNSEDVVHAAGPEDGRITLPYGRMSRIAPQLPEKPAGVATEAASETPAPLSGAPVSRSISDAVFHQTRVAKYELTGTLGHGSFGDVYTARDTELDREVALKILNPSHHGDAEAMHRFLREARAAARIAHPGIVTVHDCGRYAPEGGNELAYIAMERLCGESLTERLARVGSLPAEAAAEVVRQVAAALDAAHRADVLHRDLKPDNVYLVPDPAVPSGERAKVLDFGLAKIGTSRHTRLGSVFGTPLYMSPEQCRSSASTDARSDIYALGCILFELLAGRAPFEGAIYQVIQRHLHEAAPRVASLVPAVPPALDGLVAAMLEKDPALRPQTMADVVRALDDLLAAPRGDRDGDAPAEGAAAVAAAVAAADAPRARGTGARASIENDAVAPVTPPFASFARRPARGARGWLALLAAIAIALALAATLTLMAEHRASGLERARPARPAVPATLR
jgi:serine/threonine-protein kinase